MKKVSALSGLCLPLTFLNNIYKLYTWLDLSMKTEKKKQSWYIFLFLALARARLLRDSVKITGKCVKLPTKGCFTRQDSIVSKVC